MKIIIFLNGERGLSVLNSILENSNFEIIGIVTPLKFNFSKLQITNIPHFSHLNVNEETALENFRSLKPDIFLIAGYSDIFKSEILAIPKIATLNLHAGKLPEYRGGSPLNWQIINGESKAGLSVIKVDLGIDSGEIVAEALVPITNETTISELHHQANQIFPELVLQALNEISSGSFKTIKQDEKLARYWHQRNDRDGHLDFLSKSAVDLDRIIRAVTIPYPGAWCHSGDNKVRIFEASINSFSLCGSPGRICYLQGRGPYIICKEGSLLVTSYRVENSSNGRLKNGEYLV